MTDEPRSRMSRLGAGLAAERRRRRAAAEQREPDASFGSLRISWLLVVVAAVVVIGIFTLAPSISLLIEQRADIANLQAQVDAQTDNVDDLESEVARWDEPAYIEAQARDRLFYVYPGEQSYVVLDDRDPLAAEAPAEQYSTDVQATESDWAQAALESIVVAGLTDDSPDDIAGTDPAPADPAPTDEGGQ